MIRKSLQQLDRYVPGTTIEEVQRRLGLDRIIKLASNENPLGSSPKALAAIARADRLNLYLDDAHTELRERLALPYGLAVENVVLGHGSNELVKIVCDAVLEVEDEAIFATPGFLLYPIAVALRGAVSVPIALSDGVHDVDAILEAVTERTSLVIVCDPNNPTGTALSREQWEALVRGLPDRVTLLVDQAYCEYMGPQGVDAVPFIAERPNTIVLRTMSKIYGLASLRFGYAFAEREIAGWLNRIRLPFNVSRTAALGAAAALDDRQFVAHSIETNTNGKAFMYAALETLGLHVYPTEANFYAVEVPVPAHSATEDLLQRGIIVRSGDSLRMPGRLRITIGTAAENAALAETLRELLPQWRSATSSISSSSQER